MSESLNWMMLTDLHLDPDERSGLWPSVKNDVYRDYGKIADQISGCSLGAAFADHRSQPGKTNHSPTKEI